MITLAFFILSIVPEPSNAGESNVGRFLSVCTKLLSCNMKLSILAAFLLIAFIANAQDTTKVAKDTVENKNSTHGRFKKDITERQKRFEVGGGVQVNAIEAMSTFVGPSFSFKANSRYGRLAGIFNMSYNFGNTFNALHTSYYNYSNQGNPKEKYLSDIRYNFLKVSAAMVVPFFNRSNKKGFGISGVMGISYYNGLGSGEYFSFMDKPNPPTLTAWELQYVRPTYKFTYKNNNLLMAGFDIGLSFTYTYQMLQFFADIFYMRTAILNRNGETGTINSKSDTGDNYLGFASSYSYSMHFGVRYCLYQPWQAKPPKRFGKQ